MLAMLVRQLDIFQSELKSIYKRTHTFYKHISVNQVCKDFVQWCNIQIAVVAFLYLMTDDNWNLSFLKIKTIVFIIKISYTAQKHTHSTHTKPKKETLDKKYPQWGYRTSIYSDREQAGKSTILKVPKDIPNFFRNPCKVPILSVFIPKLTGYFNFSKITAKKNYRYS